VFSDSLAFFVFFACLLAMRFSSHLHISEIIQVLLSGHFLLFFSMFVILMMVTIVPVLYLYLQPPSSMPLPKTNSETPDPPQSSDANAPDAAPPPPHCPETPSSEPGLLSLLVCVVAAAAVLLSKQQ
jgi:hypothetical protein